MKQRTQVNPDQIPDPQRWLDNKRVLFKLLSFVVICYTAIGTNARKSSGREGTRTLVFEVWAGSKSERRARSILDKEQQMGVYAGLGQTLCRARGPLPLLEMSPQQRGLELDEAISLTLKAS